jgi:hypothetical protein
MPRRASRRCHPRYHSISLKKMGKLLFGKSLTAWFSLASIHPETLDGNWLVWKYSFLTNEKIQPQVP